jgi:hypothetical protein
VAGRQEDIVGKTDLRYEIIMQTTRPTRPPLEKKEEAFFFSAAQASPDGGEKENGRKRNRTPTPMVGRQEDIVGKRSLGTR